MKRNKKQIAFNTHLILCFILFIVFLICSIIFAIEQMIVLCVVSAIFLLIPISDFFISPLYIVFSDQYIEIVYNFGQIEIIKWNDIEKIYMMGSWLKKGGGTPCYYIAYPRTEIRLFFMDGAIPKTRKTKRLLKKYYKKEIL